MSTAKALTERMDATGRKRSQSESIYTIVSDDHNVHCMTAPMLDAWWSSLNPERKAEIFDEFWDLPELSAEPSPEPSHCSSKYAEYSRQFFAQFHGELGDALADLRNALAAQPTRQPNR